MPTDISTPCVSICVLDAAGRVCLGCGRTVKEIGAWSTMSENERRAVMTRLSRKVAR